MCHGHFGRAELQNTAKMAVAHKNTCHTLTKDAPGHPAHRNRKEMPPTSQDDTTDMRRFQAEPTATALAVILQQKSRRPPAQHD